MGRLGLGLGLAVIQYYLAFAFKLFYYVFFDLYLTSGVWNISQTSVIRTTLGAFGWEHFKNAKNQHY